MKRVLLAIFYAVSIIGCQKSFISDDNIISNSSSHLENDDSENFYYWCDGKKIPLHINRSKSFIVFREDEIQKDANVKSSNSLNFNRDNIYQILGIHSPKITLNNIRYQKQIVENNIDSGLDTTGIDYIAPFFTTNEGIGLGITDIFSVQLSSETDAMSLNKIVEDYNVELLGANKHDPSIYYLRCNNYSKGNALEIANCIYESGLFKYATPEFIVESFVDSVPNDPLFKNQWNLNNSTNTLIDIEYIEMMESYTFPHLNNVIVAVIDSGINLNHEDLNICDKSFNAHTGENISNVYGDHGTQVAGVIGAYSNNNKGICGVAPGVKLMSISLCFTKDAERLGISSSTTTQFANAIRYAANNGAKVINNSWSFNTSSPIAEINNAIIYAQKKGCIVVFSAGNDNAKVSQPAAGSPSGTIIVGSIGKDGYKSNFSNYGTSLDMCAPGEDIMTTDRSGGYTTVNGTSFSAPHVAGVAAMLFARDINIQSNRVRDILEQSVKKIGQYEYLGQDTKLNGPWNQYFGYGLINARAAMDAVNGEGPIKPILYSYLKEITNNDLFSMGLDYDIWDKVYLVEDGVGSSRFMIDNYDSSTIYEWRSSLPPYYGVGAYFDVSLPDTVLEEPVLHEVKCKALKNGSWTQSGLSLALVPYNYKY